LITPAIRYIIPGQDRGAAAGLFLEMSGDTSMKKTSILAAALIILTAYACTREGADNGAPSDLYRTWTLYQDCPNNAITFKRNGTYEWMECYSDDRGEEKIDRWTGTYAYVSEKEINVRHKSGAVNRYSLETADGRKTLKQGGFVFHPASR
jgi:hypothetical protein